MSQVIAFPAASHEFAQVALSPSIFMYDLEADNSRSFGEAVTDIEVFSLKRRAVSLTTAKASGRISFNTFSEIS